MCIRDRLILIAFLMSVVLFLNGNYVVYILSYVFCFTFLFCHAVFSASTICEKIAQIIVYALILTAQILFAVLVIEPSKNQELCRLMGVIILFVPFLIRKCICWW